MFPLERIEPLLLNFNSLTHKIKSKWNYFQLENIEIYQRKLHFRIINRSEFFVPLFLHGIGEFRVPSKIYGLPLGFVVEWREEIERGCR